MSQSSSEQHYSLSEQSRSPTLSDFTEEETLEDTLPHEDQLQQFAHPRVVASPRSMIQRPRRGAVRAQLSAPAVAVTDPLAVREAPATTLGYGCNTRCGSNVLRGAPLGVNPPAPHSGSRARNSSGTGCRCHRWSSTAPSAPRRATQRSPVCTSAGAKSPSAPDASSSRTIAAIDALRSAQPP